MFLDVTLKRNPQLIQTAISLHRKGEIYPNTYVLDLDIIRHNVRELVKAAQDAGIQLYMMTKQIGRNPEVARIIADCGIEKAVAVDPWEALVLAGSGIKLGHVGHLVQIPSSMVGKILSYQPEVVTVFSVEKAVEISDEALKMGRKQDILLKVIGLRDMIYEVQTGGFKESELLEAVIRINRMPGVRIAGLTAFPCFIYDPQTRDIRKTENANTLIRCAEMLRNQLGIDIDQVNAPSANTVSSLPLLAEIGATHAEPGHAITGTTPRHEYSDQKEIPAMVYVSEISHIFDNKAYVFGGGYYRRSYIKKAMVGKDFEEMANNLLEAEEISPEAIDYYGSLRIGDKQAHVGDTVIYAFRTQIFVTRSQVALVDGIHTGRPELKGVYDNLGNKLR